MKAILEGIAGEKSRHSRTKKSITQSWKHYKLKRFFAASAERSTPLTFQQLEEIDDQPLPKTARMDRSWWNQRPNCNMIAEAWLTKGYELHSINLTAEKLTLHRQHGMSKLKIPEVLLDGALPDNAVYELETHIAYVIEKYGLKKGEVVGYSGQGLYIPQEDGQHLLIFRTRAHGRSIQPKAQRLLHPVHRPRRAVIPHRLNGKSAPVRPGDGQGHHGASGVKLRCHFIVDALGIGLSGSATLHTDHPS